MSTRDSLGDRMKDYYENRSKTFLLRREPVIIRLDGKAFHTFTKNFARPYDSVLHECMEYTMRRLCEQIQGCKLGYTQSDEITLLLTDYDTLTTDAWFDYNVQKICSVAASMATLAFNCRLDEIYRSHDFTDDKHIDIGCLSDKLFKATFDCRCFNVPVSEVTNCFIWRQNDATRNAIQMLGQTYFSHSQLNEKSCSDIQEMLMAEHNINFNDMPTKFKRGCCCKREIVMATVDDFVIERNGWVIDEEIPIFTQDRDYIERLLIVDSE